MPRIGEGGAAPAPAPAPETNPTRALNPDQAAHLHRAAVTAGIQDVSDRISHFDMQMISDAPITVAALVASKLDTSTLQTVASGLGPAWRWLKVQHSSPDAPGSGNLLVPHAIELGRGKATAEQATEQTTQGNEAPPGEPTPPQFGVSTWRRPTVVNHYASGQTTAEVVNGEITVTTPDQNSPEVKTVLAQALKANPQLNVEGATFRAPGFGGAVAGIASDLTQFIGKPFDVIGGLGNVVKRDVPVVGGAAGTGINAFAKGGNYLFGGATDIIAGGLQATAHDIAALLTHHPVLNPLDYMFPGLMHHGPVGSGYGAAVADSVGIPKTSPAYQQTAGFFDFAGQWVVGGAVAKGFAASHAAGIELPVSEGAQMGARTSIAQSIFDLRQSISKTGDVSQWLQSRHGNAMARDMASVMDANPDSKAGALLGAYSDKAITPQMATAVADVYDGTRASIKFALNEWYRRIYDVAAFEDKDALIAQNTGIDGELAAAEVRTRRGEGPAPIDRTMMSAEEEAQLKAQRVVNSQALEGIVDRPPELYPKPSAIRRVSADITHSRLGSLASFLYNPLTHSGSVASKLDPFNLSSVLRNFPRDTTLHSLADPGALTTNINIIRPYLLSSGLSGAQAASVLDEFARLEKNASVYEAASNLADRLGEIARKRGADPMAVEAVNRLWKSNIAGVDYGRYADWRQEVGPDGRTTWAYSMRHAMPDLDPVTGQEIPRPMMTSQLTDTVRLPDYNRVMEATRLRKIIEQRLRQARTKSWEVTYTNDAGDVTTLRSYSASEANAEAEALGGTVTEAGNVLSRSAAKAAYAPLDLLHGVAHLGRVALRIPWLLARAPAILMKMQPEEALANWFDPSQTTRGFFARVKAIMSGDPLTARSVAEARTGITPPEIAPVGNPEAPGMVPIRKLGTFVQESAFTPSVPLQNRVIPTFKIAATGGAPVPQIGAVGAIYDWIAQAGADPAMRQLAKLGPGDDFLTWLNSSGKDTLGRLKNTMQGRGRAYTPEDLMNNAWKTMLAHTGGDETLIAGIADHTWYTGNPVTAAATERGWATKQHFDPGFTKPMRDTAALHDIENEMNSLNERQALYARNLADARARGDQAGITVIREQQLAVRSRIAELGDVVGNRRLMIPLSDRENMTAEIRSRLIADRTAATAEGRPPAFIPEVTVPVPGTGPRFGESAQAARDMQTRMRRLAYTLKAPLRWYTSVDNTVGARQSTFFNLWSDNYRRLISEGFKGGEDGVADHLARDIAGEGSTELHYSMNTRTSFQSSTRNLFWYSPVTQQFYKRWLFDLPRKYTWPVGVSYLANRINLVGDLLQGAGVIRVNKATGQLETPVPGVREALQLALNALHGPGALPAGDKLSHQFSDVAFNPLTVLNMNPGDFGFGLSPVPASMLSEAARNIPGLHVLSNALLPYGLDAVYGPPALTHAYEWIFGQRPPWDLYSKDVQDEVFNSAQIDAARMAWVSLQEQGKTPPDIAPFRAKYPSTASPTGLSPAGEQAYYTAMQGYLNNTVAPLAADIGRGNAFLAFLSSSAFPSSMHTIDPGERAWQTYYATTIAPVMPTNGAPASPEQIAQASNLMYSWIAQHPDWAVYTIPKSQLGISQRTIPGQSEDSASRQYMDELMTGQRKVLPPDQYLPYMAGMTSYRMQNLRHQAELDKLGGWDKLLTSGYFAKSTSQRYWADWQEYLAANPTFAGQLKQSRLNYSQQPGGFVPTPEAVSQLVDALHVIRGIAQTDATDGVRPQELVTASAKLAAALNADYAFPDTPYSTTVKGLSWYASNVLTPYYAQLEPLYTKINAAEAAGADTNDLWAQVRTTQYDWSRRVGTMQGPGGITAPDPAAIVWGNLNSQEQTVKLQRWSSQPATWLSPFALSKVTGAATTPATWDALSKVADIQAQVATYIKTFDNGPGRPPGVSPGSAYYKTLQSWSVQQQTAAAAGDPVAAKMVALDQLPPFQRMMQLGTITNPAFERVAATAQTLLQALQANQSSSKTDSGYALTLKNWFFPQIDAMVDPSSPTYDQSFADLMDQLSLALTSGGKPEVWSAPLYDRLFFDNWYSSIPGVATGAPAPANTTGG